MAKKSSFDCYSAFARQVARSREAAMYLRDTLTNFNPEKLEETMKTMHAIEHAADIEKHEMMNQLVREFITPIDREDIIHLSQEIDEITDSIEDVLIKMYIFNITKTRPEALEFVEVIAKCCESLETAVMEFKNYKKSVTIHNLIVEINALEEVGDRLYTNAIRTLYTTCKDPIMVSAWTAVYEHFEKCCDACEHTANVIESVITKNS